MVASYLWRAVAIAVVLVQLIVPAPAPAIDGTPTWVQSRVGTPAVGNFASSPSLAFDHYGTPSVAWSEVNGGAGSNSVYRSSTDGLGFWSHQTIETGAGVGLLTSLSFDRSERPTVAWVNGNGAVKTMFNNTILQTVSGGGANATRPALCISHDLAGTLRGVFSGGTPGNLFDLNGASGAHTSGSIGTIPNVTNVNDLRLITDYSGRRHLAARVDLSTNNQGVVVASEPIGGSGPWTSSVLATADSVSGISIATSPTDGKIAIAYTTLNAGTNTSKLFYAKSTGTILQTTEVQSSTSAVFEDLDLAFDLSDGRPAIAYERKAFSPFAQEIRFAYATSGGSWLTSLVDGTVSMDNPLGFLRRPSLAFDDYGTSWPAISYVDADGSVTVSFDPPGAAPEPSTLCLISFASLLTVVRGSHRRENRAMAAG